MERIIGYDPYNNCGFFSCVIDQETNPLWNDTVWIDHNWNISREYYVDHTVHYNSSTTYTPPLHLYQFPLYVGKTWWSNSTFAGWYTDQTGNHTQPGPYDFSIRRTIVNQTTVTVPAGTFDTFLVAQYVNKGTVLDEYRWFSLQAKTSVKLVVLDRITGLMSDSYLMTSYSLVLPILHITGLSPNPARPLQSVRLDYTATETGGIVGIPATWVDWGDNTIPDLIFNMTSSSMCQRTQPYLYSNDCTVARNSLVLAQAQKDPSTIVNGSIIIFRPYPQDPAYLVMHRIIKVIPPSDPSGQYSFLTQGDANPGPDYWNSPGGIPSNQVIGVYQSTLASAGHGQRYDTHTYPGQGNIPSSIYTITVNATDENDSHTQTTATENVIQNFIQPPTPSSSPTPPQTYSPISPFLIAGAAVAVLIAISAAVLLTVRTKKKYSQPL